MQSLFETVLNRPNNLICQQNNSAIIQIVHSGYSPKLRHMRKFHKLNLAVLYEVFSDPRVRLQYIRSLLQCADPFIKALESCKWADAHSLMHIKAAEQPCT